ncbi:hypothetical protein FGG08_005403 [Glutinoglossum americanum]|uniref:Uncharacterized protein n=1 Tax=Glutinoglossum americanum TaxID=1670608 RepID=A0A9P8HY87_9PEZI|nr:hypothetical protein FGG08_005403 [Glutinoglossum americanum]
MDGDDMSSSTTGAVGGNERGGGRGGRRGGRGRRGPQRDIETTGVGKKGKKRAAVDDSEEDDDGDDGESDRRIKRRATGTRVRPTTSVAASSYRTPAGSQYTLRWEEYFLDLPEGVTYNQWRGWQDVLDGIPSFQRHRIEGDHIAEDLRLPANTRLRNIPSLPEWLPEHLPAIVLQALLYSNKMVTWGDIVKRMGHTWEESDPKQMYKINNKYSTAAGRWRNLIGIPSREPKLRQGRTATTAAGSINFTGVDWDDYVLLPPHTGVNLGGDRNRTHLQAPADTPAPPPAGTATVETTGRRRRPRDTAPTGPDDAVSARPYYGRGSNSAATAAAPASEPVQGRRGSSSAMPYYTPAGAPPDPVCEQGESSSAALLSRYVVLTEQELVTRAMADTATREREATLAQLHDMGIPVDPELLVYDRTDPQPDIDTDPVLSQSLLRAIAAANADTSSGGFPSSMPPYDSFPFMPTTPLMQPLYMQPVSPLQQLAQPVPAIPAAPAAPAALAQEPTFDIPAWPSPPLPPLVFPSALYDMGRLSREIREQTDSLVHRPSEAQPQVDLSNPLHYDSDEWESFLDHQRMGYEDDPGEQEGEAEDAQRLNRAVWNASAQVAAQTMERERSVQQEIIRAHVQRIRSALQRTQNSRVDQGSSSAPALPSS